MIPLSKSKQQLLFILFGLAIVLIAANILLKYFQERNSFPQKFESQSKYVNEKFLGAIKNFGLKDEWIKKSEQNDDNKKYKLSLYKISVPADLTIPEILKDIFTTFREDSIDIESVEKKAGGKSILKLGLKEHFFLQAEFDYAKNLYRNEGAIAFVIDDADLDNLQDSLLIESTEKFYLLLTPSDDNLQYLQYIKENRKGAFVLLNDEIADQKYRLSSSYTEDRIKKALNSIVADYISTSSFVFDDASELYRSEKANVIKKELERRSIALHLLSQLISLDDDDKSVEEKFNEEMKALAGGSMKIFVLDKDSYKRLLPEINQLKKKGVKVKYPSQLFL